jgi:hypothetical protein
MHMTVRRWEGSFLLVRAPFGLLIFGVLLSLLAWLR